MNYEIKYTSYYFHNIQYNICLLALPLILSQHRFNMRINLNKKEKK